MIVKKKAANQDSAFATFFFAFSSRRTRTRRETAVPIEKTGAGSKSVRRYAVGSSSVI